MAQAKNADVLFGDEALFPPWGTLRDTGVRRGRPPVAKTSGKRQGYQGLGLIDYFTGRFFYRCREDRLNSATYEAFLRPVLRKTRQPLILIQDGARYHTRAAMKALFEQHSERITVFQRPRYSPDFNPIEKLWKKIKEQGTHRHDFPTFESLKDKVEEALVEFKNTPAEVLFLFVKLKDLRAAA